MGRQLRRAPPPLAAGPGAGRALGAGQRGRPDPATAVGPSPMGPGPATAKSSSARPVERGHPAAHRADGQLQAGGCAAPAIFPPEAWSGLLLAPGRTNPSEARHECRACQKHGQIMARNLRHGKLIAHARLGRRTSRAWQPWQAAAERRGWAWARGARYGPPDARAS